jgi:sugar/nucleoside kinase (ribokinase family)
MKKFDVFCYGEIGIDNIIEADRLPTPERAVFPKSESYHVGGAAANTAIWLAHMGLDVGLSGNVIGDDQYGRLLIERLKKHSNLDLRLVKVRKEITTPFTRAIVTPDGERSFLIFYYPQTPKVQFALGQLKGAQYLALDLYGGTERLEAAKAGHKARISTVIGDVIWKEHAVLPFTSIATNSGSYIRSEFPGIDVRQHSRELQALNRGIIITTNGEKKIHVIGADRREFQVQPIKMPVKDATGAGDAFRSGLLFGLTQGKTLEESVCLGAAAGSLKVGHFGAATTLPHLKEIIEVADGLTVEST